MVSITLLIDKKETLFRVPFISGRVMRASFPTQELVKEFADGKKPDTEAVDALAAFVCMAFGDQFTIDQLLDGMCCSHMVRTAMDIAIAIHNMTADALGDFPPTAGAGA